MQRYLIYPFILLGLTVLDGAGLLDQPVAQAQITSAAPGAAPAQGTPTPSPTACGPAWQLVSGPNAGFYPTLYSVSSSGPSDVWAVGRQRYGQNTYHTLTEHWDGAAWTVVPSPNVGTGTNTLYGVVARSPTDAWAVGTRSDIIGPYDTLIEHWDGTAWTVVPSPNPGLGSGGLTSVSALAADNVWAVGQYPGTDYDHTLVLHWDGTAWTQVPSPSVAGLNSYLSNVAARTSTDIWAVGSADSIGSAQTLIEHWDGSTWTLVPGPDPGPPYNNLLSVAALAANDAWAVGLSSTGTTLVGTLVEHWNGSAWTLVPGPPVAGGFNSVAGTASNNLWAVGEYEDPPGTNDRTLLAHWDGSAWTQVSTPNPGYGNNWLYGVTMLSASDGWAVGASSPGPPILHYTPNCGTPTPSATPPMGSPTVTPQTTGTSTPTATLVASATPGTTSTATPSVTVCPLQFADVAPSDPFYPYIRCLSCRQILSGYNSSPPCAPGGTPCFNGGATITRGQVAKIVANAAGYTDVIPSTQQTFTDMPSSSPFWVFIERAVLHGVISGYTTSPPLTREQLAKIDANAAGFAETIPSTQQTFTDVPYGNPFWLYVERGALHGVISGYSTSPPCPGAVPCFLPGNSVTRNQTAKIVATTSYPSCQTPFR